jgi:hypothetical protein
LDLLENKGFGRRKEQKSGKRDCKLLIVKEIGIEAKCLVMCGMWALCKESEFWRRRRD